MQSFLTRMEVTAKSIKLMEDNLQHTVQRKLIGLYSKVGPLGGVRFQLPLNDVPRWDRNEWIDTCRECDSNRSRPSGEVMLKKQNDFQETVN